MSRVLITGTSKGIGYAAALAFARAGHEVYATMRKPQSSPQLGEAAAAEGLTGSHIGDGRRLGRLGRQGRRSDQRAGGRHRRAREQRRHRPHRPD